jgi:glutathione S-transferase
LPGRCALTTDIADMDATLARTPWLAGDDYGLADIAATP